MWTPPEVCCSVPERPFGKISSPVRRTEHAQRNTPKNSRIWPCFALFGGCPGGLENTYDEGSVVTAMLWRFVRVDVHCAEYCGWKWRCWLVARATVVMSQVAGPRLWSVNEQLFCLHQYLRGFVDETCRVATGCFRCRCKVHVDTKPVGLELLSNKCIHNLQRGLKPLAGRNLVLVPYRFQTVSTHP